MKKGILGIFLSLILELPYSKYYSLHLGQVFKFKDVIEMTTFGESVSCNNGPWNLAWALGITLNFLICKGKKRAEIEMWKGPWQN